jgi:hypothetical protein
MAMWPGCARPAALELSYLHSKSELRTISFWARLGYSGDIRIVLKSGDLDDRAFWNSTRDRDDCERAGIILARIGAIRAAAPKVWNESWNESYDESSCNESCGRFAATGGRRFESRGVMP